MNAYAYLRVSSEDQAESGAGLAAQRAAVEAFAKANGMTIIGTFEDAAVSGAKSLEQRPGLMACVGQLRRGEAVVIAKRDRLGRDELAVLMIERAVQRRGGVIRSADGVGNGSDAASQFMKSVIDAASAYERNLIRARTKAAMAAKRSAGERVGEIPFGWQLGDDGRLVADADEQAVIEQIRRCRAAGLSLRAIAKILTDAGRPTKKGTAVWNHNTIDSILKRADALSA
jgi:DNA invertase Pin-like site-specific DNA recombinase